MTRRRLLLVAVPAALVLLGASGWLFWPQPTAITLESVKMIQRGMTLHEVQEILGGSARDETDGASTSYWTDLKLPRTGKEVAVATHRWTARNRKVEVDINAEGRVIALWSGYPAGALLDKVRRWLGL